MLTVAVFLFQPSILKYRRQRRTSAVMSPLSWPTPCIGLPAMRQGAAVAASVASVAAASVALAAAWRQPIPAYGRPGGGVSRSYTDLSPAVLDDSHDAADDSAVGQHGKTIRRYALALEQEAR